MFGVTDKGKDFKSMKAKKGTIIGLLAMIIVLATSAVCLFGCGKSDDDDEEENE